jgi:hypothetical protein
MQSAQHGYSALLLEQHRVEEAEAVYRADLGLDDTWLGPASTLAMSGACTVYHECLTLLGEHEQAHIIKEQLNIAAARADVPISSSCYCRLTPAANH